MVVVLLLATFRESIDRDTQITYYQYTVTWKYVWQKIALKKTCKINPSTAVGLTLLIILPVDPMILTAVELLYHAYQCIHMQKLYLLIPPFEYLKPI